jgi:ParB family chromosome partitioning protein
MFDQHRTWLLDGDLLGRLAAEKLEGVAEAVRAEGWRWVEVGFGYPHGSGYRRRVHPSTRESTPEEAQERERLETRLEEIAVILDGSEDDGALAGEAAAIERRLVAIESGLDAFAPEQLALAGAVVWLDHQGTAAIERGLVRREDKPAPEPRASAPAASTDAAPDSGVERPDANDAAPIAGDMEAPEAEGPRPLSERLVEDLTAHRTAGLRLALAEQPETALVAVVHALAVRLFHGCSWDPGSCLDLQPREPHLVPCSDTIAGSSAVAAFEATRRRWRARLPSEEGELWNWLVAADPATRLELLAFCAGVVVDATRRRSGQPGRGALAHADQLAAAVGLDLRDSWHPTRAAFLDKASKRHILAAVAEVAGEAKAQAWEGLKKEALIELAEPVLSEARWLPEPLRSRGVAIGEVADVDSSVAASSLVAAE